jgi:hypothetical protein
MAIIYTFPSSHYNAMPIGVPLDDIEIEAVAATPGTPATAVMRLNVNSQVFTNVRVTIAPSRQTLQPGHNVAPEAALWDVDPTTPPSVVFERDVIPPGGPTITFTVNFLGVGPANVIFVYRVQCDQLIEPVEQHVIVAVA